MTKIQRALYIYECSFKHARRCRNKKCEVCKFFNSIARLMKPSRPKPKSDYQEVVVKPAKRLASRLDRLSL